MASIPRSLSRLLRRQTPAPATAITTRTPTSSSIRSRTAQTQATQALKDTPPPPFSRHVNAQKAPSPSPARPQPTTSSSADVLSTHPLLHTLRRDNSLKETRPHLSMPSSLQPTHLVAGALSGETKLPSAPYMFLSRQPSPPSTQDHQQPTTHAKSTSKTLLHIGPHLCGHPGYIHGGLLSVLFDEVFAHTVSQSFRSGTGMTANLNVDFRKPAIPNRVFLLEAETVRVEGRKAWVEGRLRMMGSGDGDGEGVLVAEARALFVEPKFAESMGSVYRN